MTDMPTTAPEPLAAGVAVPAPASRDLSERLLAASRQWPGEHPRGFLVLAAVSWALLYRALIPVSEALVGALPVDRARLKLSRCRIGPLVVAGARRSRRRRR